MDTAPDKLTLKQRLWLKYYFETFNQTEAARKAGYKCKNDDHFRNIGTQNYAKLRPHIEKWLDENGLSDTYLKIKIVEGMEATEERFFQFQGIVTDSREVTAWETRRKYVDMGCKVKGLYAPEKINIVDTEITVKFKDDKSENEED
jgi:hypothetical protein